MKIDVYQSTVDGSRVLSVPAGTDVRKLSVEGDDAPLYASVSAEKSLTIDVGDKPESPSSRTIGSC